MGFKCKPYMDLIRSFKSAYFCSDVPGALQLDTHAAFFLFYFRVKRMSRPVISNSSSHNDYISIGMDAAEQFP